MDPNFDEDDSLAGKVVAVNYAASLIEKT